MANVKLYQGLPKPAKIHKSPKRPPSENTWHGGEGPGSNLVDEASGGEGDRARASSPIIASFDVGMFENDLKPKGLSSVTSKTSDVSVGVSGAGPFKRVVRAKKQLTPEQVAAIATARRREMSPLLQDDAVQVEVAFAFFLGAQTGHQQTKKEPNCARLFRSSTNVVWCICAIEPACLGLINSRCCRNRNCGRKWRMVFVIAVLINPHLLLRFPLLAYIVFHIMFFRCLLPSCCVYAASCVCLDHANFFSCVGMHVFALFSLFLTIFIVGERMGLGSQETDWCWLWPCLRLSILVGSFPFHCAPREASRCVCLFSFSCSVSCGAAHPQNPVVHAQIRV